MRTSASRLVFLVLAGYFPVYCLPCVILLVLGLSHGDEVRARLQRVFDRFSAGTAKWSVPIAINRATEAFD